MAGSYFAVWLGSFLMEGLVPYRLDMCYKNDLGYCGKGFSVLSSDVSVLWVPALNRYKENPGLPSILM